MSVSGTASGERLPEPAAVSRTGRWRLWLDAMAGRVPPRRLPLVVYAVCQVIFLFWWAAFYPGLISYDSVTYLIHVTTGPWVDNHSVLYDALVWLSLHATGGLGVLTLAQTVAMSAALAYTVMAFRRLGVPGRWTAVAAVVVAVLPPIGTFVVFVWKDVGFSICAYLVVPTLAHLLSLRGDAGWRVNRLIAALGLELLGVCLFRLDGTLVASLTAVVLLVLVPGVRARLAAAAAAAVCLAFALNLFVYPAAGIQRAPTSLALGPAYADIAVAYAARPSSFTTADRALMARVTPLSEWKKTANCYDADWTTTVIPGFSANASKVSGQLFSLWLRVLGRSPDLILGARICRGSIAWSIFQGPSQLDAQTLIAGLPLPPGNWQRIEHNPYRHAVLSRPLSSTANKAGTFLWRASKTPQLDWLLWRAPFWCYLCYLMVFAVARARRNWPFLSLAAIVAGQQVVVLGDNPAQLFRYMVSPIVIGIMIAPLFFARHRLGPGASMGDSPTPPA
jgi:hypothetical protein